ncbi:MAG: Rieske 2Fe-2S domain-containing protein [Candidatus Binataceae bacterium]
MRLIRGVRKFLGGWPGGWKKYALGLGGSSQPAFIQPADPDDRRSLLPPLGLREYWYPAIPARDINRKKPVGLRICGVDIVLFKDLNGQVQALRNVCPHRGAWLSWGDCFWKGHLSCPYHGATFDGDGNCVEFITEGPDSKMVGRLQARKFPTRTLKGVVFVWMGEGAAVAIEEDAPPELFDDSAFVRHTFRYWPCNWMISLENTYDAHNCFFVHRNSIWMSMTRYAGRPRTPLGYRARIINNRSVRVQTGANEYYAKDTPDGKVPFQMYYPRVRGYWPLNRYRLAWTWITERILALKLKLPRFETPEEWEGTRPPGIQRISTWDSMYTRWVIPVEENITRVMYLYSARPASRLDWIRRALTWPLYNFIVHYNFSDQDFDAIRTVQYQYPEFLSSTDSYLVMVRKLFTEHARGVKKTVDVAADTTAEKLVREGDQSLNAKSGTGSAAGNGEGDSHRETGAGFDILLTGGLGRASGQPPKPQDDSQ